MSGEPQEPQGRLVLKATQMTLVGDRSMGVNIAYLAMEVLHGTFILAMLTKQFSFRRVILFVAASFILDSVL